MKAGQKLSLPELQNFLTQEGLRLDIFVGVHGYKQSQDDIDRVIEQKKTRKQYQKWGHDFINKLKEF